MTSKLHIALIQSDLVWENPEANRLAFSEKINDLPKNTDLIILPEMFTTGFTMNAHPYAETMQGETVTWMQQLAQQKNAAIVGSTIIKEEVENEVNYFNRLLFVHPTGDIEFYDKKHTFTLANEHTVYTAGTKKIHIDYKGWKICPLICYDLRFPAWARNTDYYDVLLYVASWPKPRINAWDALLKARAIENMSYTIGVNRVGTDGLNFEYSGNSVLYDTLGNCLAKKDNGEDTVLMVEIDKEQQETLRTKFSFLEDRDLFVIQ
ncbi:Omega-amidase YafV [Tenacibaculum sp. 190524A02b]|uniref:Omega-amidase YafV n=1 Tax=Tenacibaculum vairaonense TaxID=3137860 RepID=A0ABP1FEK8_9FLAO